MIKEFANSTADRHHFKSQNEMSVWMGGHEGYMSLYSYDDYVITYFKENGKLAGYDGLIYMPDEFILDVDANGKFVNARDKTIALSLVLEDLMVPYNIYFSGTGMHLGIPGNAFRHKPAKDLHLLVKRCLKSKGIFEYADHSVTDKTRLVRLVNTINNKTRLYKVQLTKTQLHEFGRSDIIKYAKTPKEYFPLPNECEPAFDLMTDTARNVKKLKSKTKPWQGYDPDPREYPCIQSLLKGASYGSRHQSALVIASHLRWRYSKDIVELIMENWRQKIDDPDKPFSETEMENIITHTYSGHNGEGNRYGCDNWIKDRHCDPACMLYRAKKHNSILTPEQMEKSIIDFYTTDQKPLQLGELYAEKFPVFPGEFILVQAPPESMKTMLLLNWVNAFKKPTWFLELEMSPRQIFTRLAMIEQHWTQEELQDHYKQYRNGVAEKFDWLIADYGACYARDLEKRLMLLPFRPEIVCIDHVGLLHSDKQDINGRTEEVAQGLMDLAIKYNIIVIGVTEINKKAFHEGTDMSSPRGSFRLAYNCSKLMDLKPQRNNNGKIVYLDLSTTKNREQERLNVRLVLDKTRLIKESSITDDYFENKKEKIW